MSFNPFDGSQPGAKRFPPPATDPKVFPDQTCSVPENTTSVLNVSGWTILDGNDAAEFSVVAGELVFLSAPDYEAPSDAGADNDYVVRLTNAADALRTVLVAVTDVVSA